MIGTERTSRAQQTVVVVVSIAAVLTTTAGILTIGPSSMTFGIDPGPDSLGVGETTTDYDAGGTNGTTLSETTSTPTSEPTTPTPEPATRTPEPVTPTPEPTAPTSESMTPTPTPSTDPAPETTLHLNPSSGSVQPDRTTTYDVVVDSANGGVGGAEMAIVVGDPSVATITEVTVLGSGDQAVDIAENGSRADINYTARDTYDSGSFSILEVTVEGQSKAETSLSFAAAAGNDELLLFDESGTTYSVTDTTGGTVTVTSGQSSGSESQEAEPDAFQLDLVEGGVIQRLDPDEGDTYHKQDRFITALHITEDERRWGGSGSPMGRTYRSNGCEVAYGHLSFHPDTGVSEVAVSVSDVGGCEGITLSYAGYELPDGTTGWDGDRAEEQDLKDSVTVTLQPGDEELLTVDVISEGTSSASSG